MMEPIAVHLNARPGIARRNEPIRFGVPFAPGQLQPCQKLCLFDRDGVAIPTQINATAHWPDGSARWIRVDALIDRPDGDLSDLTLDTRHGADAPPPIDGRMTDRGPRIDTGVLTLEVNPDQLAWHPESRDDGDGETRVELTDSDGHTCVSVVDRWEQVTGGPLMVTFKATGHWLRPNDTPLAAFECRLTGYRGSETIDVELSLRNPERARHEGGLWDLGDSGSIHFRSLSVSVGTARQTSRTISLSADSDMRTLPVDRPVRLYQASSGGEHWNSRNHVNAAGDVVLPFRGYRLKVADEELANGDRAQPLISVTSNSGGCHLAMPEFWQHFPSALSVTSQSIQLDLFPYEESDCHELQGGERKTQRFCLAYGDKEDLSWTQSPTTPYLDAGVYEQANAFHWFKANSPTDALDALIARGLDESVGFFSKRERIDEYGWRHFGDLYADHETLYQAEGESPLISHYNNQYDAIYGFARQFALTGDRRWFELMNDLARHVTDIDIYHTREDRIEYNNGLFWHTDHYLDAHTATHRTFSRHNTTSSTPGQTGGGPGSEHCYTTGLLYHYWLTGNPDSRDAVLELAQWMINLHEGQGGLLEQLQAIKKQDLPKLRGLLRGTRPFSHRYPFTRGTGNYLNALLDAWQLTGDTAWMNRAEELIRACIHPADDLAQRDLLSIEANWSYLILLSSLVKYLALKRDTGDLDEPYGYAVNSLRHYTRWMVKNERPFLSQPEQLEFANDTWAAQDIRKAMLLYQAMHFDPDMASRYRTKADEWFDYVTERLHHSDEAHYSRLLVILMQNHGPNHFKTVNQAHSEPEYSSVRDRPPVLTWPELIRRVVRRLAKGVITFRPSRERLWLNTRLNRS